jgi:hypothetical protein
MIAPRKDIHETRRSASPLRVTDEKIRKVLQITGLRFAWNRAEWFQDEVRRLGDALKSGAMTPDQVDAELEAMGALDLVYPELMGGGE